MSYELAPGSTQATHPLVNPVLQRCRNQHPLVRPAVLVGRKAPSESVTVPTQPRMGEDDPICMGFTYHSTHGQPHLPRVVTLAPATNLVPFVSILTVRPTPSTNPGAWVES